VAIDYQELPVVTDMRTALDPETPVIHASLGDNLAFERVLDAGAVDAAFAGSDEVVEAEFVFGRHTGVTLEPRAVVADWNVAEARLTIYQGTQAPHMVQNIAALHLGLDEAQVRVVCKDVGGSFGIKVHIYADEMATYALSKMLKRPVKFVADRMESFNTDIHARDHRCKGRIGVNRDGTITAFEIDDLTGIGPYSMYPRTSAIEANQVVNLVGGPYTTKNYRARARVVFQNKNVMCQYRAVGHPIACSVTEGLVDLAAMKIGEEARVPLANFSLEGSIRAELRTARRRGERDRATFEVVAPGEVAQILPALRSISASWLKDKATAEKGFSVGSFSERYLRNFPIALVRRDGEPVAFANLWQSAGREEVAVDLMRFSPDAPPGAMDFLFVELMLWARQQGFAWFSLGVAPLAGLERHPLAPAWHRIGNFIFRHGEHFYNFEGLRRYKAKFHPTWEPKYLVAPGGVGLPLILVDVSVLIAGGIKELFVK